MKFLHLIWTNLWRRKVRTTFTLLSIFIGFLLFGLVMTVREAFRFGVDVAGLDRLVMMNKLTFIMPLPQSYGQRLAAVPGVEVVSHQSWFNGAYQQPTNVLPATIAVDPETHFKVYPEYKVPREQIDKWLSDRQGAIVGKKIAARWGWKIGDKIPLTSAIYEGKEPWQFNIDGIYDGGNGVDNTQFFFRYDYLDENRSERARGVVGWYIIKISDAAKAAELGHTFDSMFANSGAETKTGTEKSFIEGYVKQVGDIGAIMIAIASIVLFMFGLVAASTMVQSVRERTNELAVLKTLGFPDRSLLVLVLSESIFMTVVAGSLGLLLAWLIVQRGDPTGVLPTFYLPTSDVLTGIALMVMMGLVAGGAPALAAMRLRIAQGLRRN
jgi:putative ABC transport system permease protein